MYCIPLKKKKSCRFVFSLATTMACGGSQARGLIWAVATSLCQNQPQQCGIWAVSETYTTGHANARSLLHWARLRIKLTTSWFLDLLTTEPWQELLHSIFKAVRGRLSLHWARNPVPPCCTCWLPNHSENDAEITTDFSSIRKSLRVSSLKISQAHKSLCSFYWISTLNLFIYTQWIASSNLSFCQALALILWTPSSLRSQKNPPVPSES